MKTHFIDRSYLKTSVGLIHLRETGDGPTVVLVHGNPWAGDFWEPVMGAFACAGYHTLAFDGLGYGLSDRSEGPVSIETQARVLEEVVLSRSAPIVGVAGWHQGSVVGLDFAIRRPDLCKALVFDGAATVTDDDFFALMAKVARNNPAYPFEGNERTWWADYIYGTLKVYNPHFELNQNTWPIFRTLLINALQVDPKLAYGMSPMVPESVRKTLADANNRGRAPPLPEKMKRLSSAEATTAPELVAAYPWPERMALLEIPVLILSSEDEPLRSAHAAILSQAKFGAEFIYPGGHPQIGVGREAEFVAPIVNFLKEHG